MDTSQIYIELLHRALWGGAATNERMEELTSAGVNEIIRLAAFQGTGPLVYDQLIKHKDAEISPALCMQMKQHCLQSMKLQQTMNAILVRAVIALRNEEIYPVLLKGMSIAQHYPQPYLRQWGDIDLYVGQKQYHRACKVLGSVLPEAKHPAEEFEFLKHYNFVFPNTVLEMHRISMEFAHPLDRRYYEHLEAEYLTKDGPTFDVDGLAITTPDETFNVFFVFLHAWEHFVETGMNMKQLCDIAILLHTKREAINIEQLHEMLSKLHLLEVWQLIIYIMVHQLGVPQEECPFYTGKSRARAELLLKRILLEGSARQAKKVNTEGVSYLKRKWITLQLRMSDCKLVQPYAPKYARHMLIGDVIHGIERTIKSSEKAYNVECV